MYKVLLIEAPGPDRDLLWAFFNGIESQLEMVSNLPQTKETFGRGQHDLVITDVRPPGADGFEIVRELHDMSIKLTPFLFVSGLITEDEAMRNVQPDTNVIGLLRKPIFILDLVEKLRGVVPMPEGDLFLELIGRLESGDAGLAALDQLLRGSGDLSRMPFGRVLYACFETKRTGRLSITTATGAVRIFFFRGEVIYLESERQEDSLIRSLTSKGNLKDVTIPESAKPENIEEEIGLLMATRAMQPHKLPEALEQLLTDIIVSISTEDAGGYRLEPADPPNRFSEAYSPIRLLMHAHEVMVGRQGDAMGHRPDTQLGVRIPLNHDLERWKLPAAELRLANRLRQMVGRKVVLDDFLRVYGKGEPQARIRARAFLSMLEDIGYLDFRPPEFGGPDTTDYQVMLKEAHRIRHLNFFQLLGVRARADKEELKKAYLKVAQLYHPDRYHERPQRLQELATHLLEQYKDAYETLAKERRRKAYVTGLSDDEFSEAGGNAEDLHNPVRGQIFWKEAERFLKVGKWSDAEKNLDEAIRFDSSKAIYHATLGWVRYKQDPEKHKAEAMTHLRTAVDMNNNCDRAHYFMGMIAKTDGDVAKAELYFSRAAAANEANVEAARELRLLESRTNGEVPRSRKKGGGLLSGLFGKGKG